MGYDTSTNLLLSNSVSNSSFNETPKDSTNRLFNFVRWDAVYYSQMAQRGNIFEQEWAFGIGLSGTISFLRTCILPHSETNELSPYVLTAILLSHFAHWATVLLLRSIAVMIVRRRGDPSFHISFVAAALHVVSPAGIFLSAPYAESTFACLNMLGLYFYLKSTKTINESAPFKLPLKVLSGIAFALATMIRSNGILAGLIFLLDAGLEVFRIFDPRLSTSLKPSILINLLSTVVAGLLIAIGFFLPQYWAYIEYCSTSTKRRSWCNSILPSIFTFVQAHYWNVGFMQYWSLSNLPLFLLAAPMLYILIHSGFEGISSMRTHDHEQLLSYPQSARLALPQLVLALLALTNYHVQIINRLSSAYPFWYIWLASRMQLGHSLVTIRFMVLYGLIQAGLYASFLPPA